MDDEMKWRPISEAQKDETSYLLFFPETEDSYGGIIEGWWFSSPKGTDDGWETIVGTIGEPTHFMELPEPPEQI